MGLRNVTINHIAEREKRKRKLEKLWRVSINLESTHSTRLKNSSKAKQLLQYQMRYFL